MIKLTISAGSTEAGTTRETLKRRLQSIGIKAELLDRANRRDEVNKMVDGIKSQATATIEGKKDLLAERAVDFEVRKAKAMQKLSNDTGGQVDA